MSTAAVIRLLRALPGGAALDEPIAEYLAGTLLELCEAPEENAEAAADALSGFLESAPPSPPACEALLRSARDAAAAPPAPPLVEALGALGFTEVVTEAAVPPAEGAACPQQQGDAAWEEAWWDECDLVEDPYTLWGDRGDEGAQEGAEESEGAEAAWRAASAHVQLLRDAFPQHDEPTVCALLLSVGGDMEAARVALEELPPPPPPPPPELDDEALFPSLGGGGGRSPASASFPRGRPPAQAPHFAQAVGAAGGGAAPPRDGVAKGARPAPLRAPALAPAASGSGAAVRWVDTGASVSALYASLRGCALDHVRLRNACFQQATQAFLAGDGALAKRLAAQGRVHNQAMFQAHDDAAGAIFNARNADGGQDSRTQAPMVDLHGLHVAEALAMLRRALPALRAEHGSGAAVHVLVGTGHHTVGANTPARLPAAVQALVRDELRLRCRQRTAGLLEVVL